MRHARSIMIPELGQLKKLLNFFALYVDLHESRIIFSIIIRYRYILLSYPAFKKGTLEESLKQRNNKVTFIFSTCLSVDYRL
jgi:hypothetical protein